MANSRLFDAAATVGDDPVTTQPPPAAPNPNQYNSPDSNQVIILVNYQPSAPYNLVGSGLGTFLTPQVVLNWINPPNCGTIVVQRTAAGPTGPYTTIAMLSAPAGGGAVPSTYTDLTVVNAMTYEYQVYATP